MVKRESIQKKLQKVCFLCVQMMYDVEIGDVIEKKELVFVIGVVGDFGGNLEVLQLCLKDCKFINIDFDNFDEVMKGIELCVVYCVFNEFFDKGGEFVVELKFCLMEDFCFEFVVQQVELLCKLLEVCIKLVDLCNKIVGNDKLEDIFSDVFNSIEKLVEFSK